MKDFFARWTGPLQSMKVRTKHFNGIEIFLETCHGMVFGYDGTTNLHFFEQNVTSNATHK